MRLGFGARIRDILLVLSQMIGGALVACLFVTDRLALVLQK